ncbi:hypothetical protein JCM11641_000472 [Rhodosporidiobolus odoratus]
MGKLLGRLWVSLVVLLISFLGFTSQLFIVLPSFPSISDPALLRLILPFNGLLFFLYLNYYLTVSTDPGQVPPKWEPDWRQMETGEMEVKKLTGGPRYCRTCRCFKPPRAHHCRQCGHCVLKMDHHCPWVNNCVGHYNYGHFCRFLFFVDASCAYHLWMVTRQAFNSLAFFRTEPTTFQMVILVMNYVLGAPVLIAVGVFSLFHLWSIATNTTTIEGWEKDKVASLKRRGKIREYRYPYHLGYLANLRAVLGDNILLWCLPQRAPGDGLSYPTAIGTEPRDQLVWPPRGVHVRPHRNKTRQPPSSSSAFTYGRGLNPSLLSSLPSQASAVPSSQPQVRQRRPRPKPAARAPWMSGSDSDHDHTAGDETQGSRVSSAPSEEEDEDDVPLGTLAARQQRVCLGGTPGVAEEDELDGRSPQSLYRSRAERAAEEDLDPDRSVRIRRGSEGYEIRPRMPWTGGQPPARRARGEAEDASDDGSWERIGLVAALPRADEGGGHGGGDAEAEETEWEWDEDGDRRRAGARYKYYVREEDSESDLESLVSVSDG